MRFTFFVNSLVHGSVCKVLIRLCENTRRYNDILAYIICGPLYWSHIKTLALWELISSCIPMICVAILSHYHWLKSLTFVLLRSCSSVWPFLCGWGRPIHMSSTATTYSFRPSLVTDLLIIIVRRVYAMSVGSWGNKDPLFLFYLQ